jgi:hypothetical protein
VTAVVAAAALLVTQLPAAASNGGGPPSLPLGKAGATGGPASGSNGGSGSPGTTTPTTTPTTTTTSTTTTTTTTTTTVPTSPTTTTTLPQRPPGNPGTNPTGGSGGPGPAGSSTTTTTSPVKPPAATPKVSESATTTTTTAPPPASLALAPPSNRCHPNPAAAIEALPTGGVWNGGGGCFTTDANGIVITQAVTVENATINDTATKTQYPKPIVRIRGGSNIVLSNLQLNGIGQSGAIRDDNSVNESGLNIAGAQGVTVTNVTTNDTGGDGLQVAFEPGLPENTGIVVNNFVSNNAGRDSATLSWCTNSTFNNFTMNGQKAVGFDFESDLANVGVSNVTVTNLRGVGALRIVENLRGPLSIVNPNFTGGISDINEAAASGQLVAVTGGKVLESNDSTGIHVSGVEIEGPGKMTLTGTILGREKAQRAPTSPAWYVTDGGKLSLDDVSWVPPVGTHDAHSGVTIKS